MFFDSSQSCTLCNLVGSCFISMLWKKLARTFPSAHVSLIYNHVTFTLSHMPGKTVFVIKGLGIGLTRPQSSRSEGWWKGRKTISLPPSHHSPRLRFSLKRRLEES